LGKVKENQDITTRGEGEKGGMPNHTAIARDKGEKV